VRLTIKTFSVALVAALNLCLPMQAHALFEDSDARREILKLRKQIEDISNRIDTRIEPRLGPLAARIEDKADTQSMIALASEIDKLRSELANARGQIEVLANDMANAQKRQKDFYVDLDERLRKLEIRSSLSEPKDGNSEAADAKPEGKSEARTDQAAFDAALALFKAASYAAAVQAWAGFLQQHPDSSYLPQAYFWLGSSHFAQQDCKSAMAAYQTLASRFSMSPQAAFALLNIASCQLDFKDKAGARETLTTLLKKYPASPAAASAKERLTELK
jgi:tol-pal system protein YbgF